MPRPFDHGGTRLWGSSSLTARRKFSGKRCEKDSALALALALVLVLVLSAAVLVLVARRFWQLEPEMIDPSRRFTSRSRLQHSTAITSTSTVLTD